MNTVDFNNVTTYENADRIDFGDLNGDGTSKWNKNRANNI